MQSVDKNTLLIAVPLATLVNMSIKEPDGLYVPMGSRMTIRLFKSFFTVATVILVYKYMQKCEENNISIYNSNFLELWGHTQPSQQSSQESDSSVLALISYG